MKPAKFKSVRLLLILLFTGVAITLVSWDQQQSPGQIPVSNNDTVPQKQIDRDKKVREPDDALNEADNADLKVNMDKIQKEIAEALKKIDGDKIKAEIQKALMEVDIEKIRQQAEESLAKVDFNKVKEDIASAMKEVDMAKIQQDVQESLAKIDWGKMQKEFEKVKDIDMRKLDADMKKLHQEMKELGPKIEKEMKKAKEEIENTKAELKEYKEFINSLDKDGLINKKEGYTLKLKDGTLYIDGKKASDETHKKYHQFLEKHKKFNISKENDDFDIDFD